MQITIDPNKTPKQEGEDQDRQNFLFHFEIIVRFSVSVSCGVLWLKITGVFCRWWRFSHGLPGDCVPEL